MGLYYTIDSYELKNIDDELFQKWADTNNPKSSYYIKAPEKPSENAAWNNGEWIVPLPNIPQSVSARQVRLWLIQNGFSLGQVDAAIDSIQDTMTRESVRVEWEYAPYIEKSHPMLAPLASGLGLTQAQIDQAFVEASQI